MQWYVPLLIITHTLQTVPNKGMKTHPNCGRLRSGVNTNANNGDQNGKSCKEQAL